MAKVLVVDDESRIADVLKAYLEREGFQVLVAGNGLAALEMVRRERPHLMLLDLMLPGLDGWEVCRSVRRESSMPIIMLTARVEEADRVTGLELGADDYVVKPFSPREVVARVKAVLRRAEAAAQGERILLADLEVDVAGHRALFAGTPLDLTPTEFRLLAVLAKHPGRTYPRAQLLELVQGMGRDALDRTMDAHVKNLRRKMDEAGCGRAVTIATVYGVGYRLEVQEGV